MLVIKADREKALVVLNLEKLVQLIAPILTKTTEKATDKPPHNPLQTTVHQEPHSRLERRTLQVLLSILCNFGLRKTPLLRKRILMIVFQGIDPVGVRNGRAKLSEADVREIRATYKGGYRNFKKLCEEYGLSS